MTNNEVDIELSRFEGSDYINKYTTDWNHFHRVWMKWRESSSAEVYKLEHSDFGMFILGRHTPSLAAYKLAKIIKETIIVECPSSISVEWHPKDTQQTFKGTVIEENEYSYLVMVDDNSEKRTMRWNKKFCTIIKQ